MSRALTSFGLEFEPELHANLGQNSWRFSWTLVNSSERFVIYHELAFSGVGLDFPK